VRFSEVNQVYLIHTIDEIKEYLPDMYWKFEKKTKLNNDFLPLKRQKFVYELSSKNTNKYYFDDIFDFGCFPI
jgi:hypothetical protein